MVRNKETFEQWTTKKRPNQAHLSRKAQGTSRSAEQSSTIRTHTSTEERIKGKGMKRTPKNTNSFSLPLLDGIVHSPADTGVHEARSQDGGNFGIHLEEKGTPERNVPEVEEDQHFSDMGTGSPDFSKNHRKEKNGFAGKVLLHDREMQSLHEVEQHERQGRSRTRKHEKKTMSKNMEKVSATRKHGSAGTSSCMRSCNSSSLSLECYEGPRERQTIDTIEKRHNHRSPSEEEDYQQPSRMHRSSNVEYRRSSRKEQHERKGRGERSRKRHHRSSGSNQSDSEDFRRPMQRSFTFEGPSRGRHGKPEDNVDRSDCSPMLLSEAETDCSEDSRQERCGKHTKDSSSSGSELPEEVADEAVVLVKSETTLRKERRDKQKLRERSVRSREKQGQKAYYLKVNHNGKPYGDRATAWRADLNKLARALDPSVMDVREQPATEMSTLRRRLRQNFDYSHPVDPILIRQLVGRAITQWRNTLWKKMDAGGTCPKGFDTNIWNELEKTRSCPSHTEKSERMKHANRCRITLGRTGPRGEDGIRELLRSQKGVSPDYDDIFAEMQRDKGYAGKAVERKTLRKAQVKVGDGFSTEGVLVSLSDADVVQVEGSKLGSTLMASNAKVVCVEEEYIKSLQSKIADLEAQICKGVLVDQEELGEKNRLHDKGDACNPNCLSVEKEGETCGGQKGISKGGTLSSRQELEEVIPKGRSRRSDSRQKLQSHMDL